MNIISISKLAREENLYFYSFRIDSLEQTLGEIIHLGVVEFIHLLRVVRISSFTFKAFGLQK